MDEDLSGTWSGTEFTDGLTRMQGLDTDGWGGPPKTYSVNLTITSQGEYENFTGGEWVSAISGGLGRHADGYFIEAIPVSGFVNRGGIVKLSFFRASTSVDWNFNGHLTLYAISRRISGDWTLMSWSNGLVLHQFGTLDVRQRGSLTSRGSLLSYRWK